MREIKFRAMYTGDLELPAMMVYGSLIDNGDGRPVIVGFNGMQQWLVDPETVGQFSGMHDKTGKEIYEGDLIQIHYNGYIPKELAVVVFVNEYVGGWNLESKGARLSLGARKQSEVEVIGNIHENPELIELDRSGGE